MNGVLQKFINGISRYEKTHSFTCDLCGREVFSGERVCAPCFKALPLNSGTFCPLCGRKVEEAGICLDCKEMPLAVERARSALSYEGTAAEAILRFKNGAKYFCYLFCDLLEPLVGEFPSDSALVAVPMTKKAIRKRGYNQSALLVKELVERTGLETLDCIEKSSETKEQKSLGRRDREKNLQGCFRVTDRAAVKGKDILIVDDTLTTGATISEIARILQKAGAYRVYALTIASVTRKDPFGKK